MILAVAYGTATTAVLILLRTARCLIGRRRGRSGAEQTGTRGRVHRAGTAGTHATGTGRHAGTGSATSLHGRNGTGTRGTLIKRLAGARGLGTQRNIRTGRRLPGHGRTLLLLAEFGDEIRTGRNNRTDDGLAGERTLSALGLRLTRLRVWMLLGRRPMSGSAGSG